MAASGATSVPSPKVDQRHAPAAGCEPFAHASDEECAEQEGEAAREEPDTPGAQVRSVDLVDPRQAQQFDARDLEHGHARRLVGVEVPVVARLVDRARQARVVRQMPMDERLRQAQPRLVLRVDRVDRQEGGEADEREQQQLVPWPSPRKACYVTGDHLRPIFPGAAAAGPGGVASAFPTEEAGNACRFHPGIQDPGR